MQICGAGPSLPRLTTRVRPPFRDRSNEFTIIEVPIISMKFRPAPSPTCAEPAPGDLAATRRLAMEDQRGTMSRRLDRLTQINLDNLVSSFGWEKRPLLASILRRILVIPARKFARQ